MKCDLRIFSIAIFLSASFVSSIPKDDTCDKCTNVEQCPLFKRMTQSQQVTWLENFSCQITQEQPQKSYSGFSTTAKGDYVCCSDKIWATENNRRNVDRSMKKERTFARYNIYKNNDYETNTNYANNNYNYNGATYNNTASNDNRRNIKRPSTFQRQILPPYDINLNQRPYSQSILEGQCSVPSNYPPDPRTGCCGLEASDDDRIIANPITLQYRAFGTSSNYNWTSLMIRPSVYPRRRRKRADERKANITLDDGVTGGKQTEFTDFPWTVLLKSEFKYATGPTAFNCGGSLISSRYVLTAGHCVFDKNGPLTSVEIYLAEYDKRTFPRDCKFVPGGGQKCIENIVMYAEEVILHPQYENEQLHNDISLVRLLENAPYTDYIRPICLPPIDIDTPQFSDLRLAVAGWGRNGPYQSDIKQSTVVNLVPQEQCKKYYPDLTRVDLCAAGYRGEDTCKGDSGGPLMTVYGGKYYVVGVVSGKRADSPCGTSVPSLYTNVYHYVNWVRSNIRN